MMWLENCKEDEMEIRDRWMVSCRENYNKSSSLTRGEEGKQHTSKLKEQEGTDKGMDGKSNEKTCEKRTGWKKLRKNR